LWFFQEFFRFQSASAATCRHYCRYEAYSLDERISVLPVAGIPELAASLG